MKLLLCLSLVGTEELWKFLGSEGMTKLHLADSQSCLPRQGVWVLRPSRHPCVSKGLWPLSGFSRLQGSQPACILPSAPGSQAEAKRSRRSPPFQPTGLAEAKGGGSRAAFQALPLGSEWAGAHSTALETEARVNSPSQHFEYISDQGLTPGLDLTRDLQPAHHPTSDTIPQGWASTQGPLGISHLFPVLHLCSSHLILFPRE